MRSIRVTSTSRAAPGALSCSKIWGHQVNENTTAVPDTYAAICRIPGVHTALFSILAGGAEIEPHRGRQA